jgi:hypothetical protein
MPSQNFTGVSKDTRPEDLRLKDWTHKELVAKTAAVEWKENAPIKKYPQRFQDGSFTCVAQTGAKILGINNLNESGVFVDISAFDIYDRRANKPAGGMWAQDAWEILKACGGTLEQFIPSQKLPEPIGVDRKFFLEQIGKIFRIQNYASLPTDDIDAMAAVLALGTPLMMFFEYFPIEWSLTPVLKASAATASSRHSITGVDFTLYQGKKALCFEDSAPIFTGDSGQRIITEDFIKTRCVYAGYSFDLMNGATLPEAEPQDLVLEKPSYIGGRLQFGEVSDRVKNLQNVLKFDGEFPMEQSSTGLYGAITAKAVKKYQEKYQVASPEELAALQGRQVGPATEKDLELRYP